MSSELRMSDEFERATGTQHFPDQLGLGLRVPLLRARGGELRVHVAKRLRGERRIVGADQEIGVGAKRLHLRFGVGHLLTHGFDLAGEPFACGACLLLLRRLLAHQVGLGNGVGDFGGEFRVLRQKVDDDDARLLHREDLEPVVIGIEHALFRRHPHRVLDHADDAEHLLERRDPGNCRVELRPFAELELVDHLAGEIARKDELHLAGHRLLIDGAAVDEILVGVRTQEDIVAPFDEDARLRQIFGHDHLDHGDRDQRREHGRAHDLPFVAPERRAERRQVGLRIAELVAAPGPRRLRRHTHFATPDELKTRRRR